MNALPLLICALCIATVSAAAPKPAAASKPAAKPNAYAAPLVLEDGNLLTVQPAKNADARPGTTALYRAEVKCAADDKVLGDCAWSGTYLTNEGDGYVNYVVTCVLNQPCGNYKPGSISMVGRAFGVDSEAYTELPIVGGTGPYANAKGIYSWKAGIGTFRLQRK